MNNSKRYDWIKTKVTEPTCQTVCKWGEPSRAPQSRVDRTSCHDKYREADRCLWSAARLMFVRTHVDLLYICMLLHRHLQTGGLSCQSLAFPVKFRLKERSYSENSFRTSQKCQWFEEAWISFCLGAGHCKKTFCSPPIYLPVGKAYLTKQRWTAMFLKLTDVKASFAAYSKLGKESRFFSSFLMEDNCSLEHLTFLVKVKVKVSYPPLIWVFGHFWLFCTMV